MNWVGGDQGGLGRKVSCAGEVGVGIGCEERVLEEEAGYV